MIFLTHLDLVCGRAYRGCQWVEKEIHWGVASYGMGWLLGCKYKSICHCRPPAMAGCDHKSESQMGDLKSSQPS